MRHVGLLVPEPLDEAAVSAHDERGERGMGGVVSWRHPRTRELADQLPDDALSFRERCAAWLRARRRRVAALVTDDE